MRKAETSKGADRRSRIDRDRLQDLIASLGLPPVRFHDLRRLGITLVLDATGGDIHQARAFAGHSSVQMTSSTYGYALPTTSKRTSAKVESMLELDLPVVIDGTASEADAPAE